MALLDVLGFETGLISSTLTQTEFDAVSVGANAALAAEATLIAGGLYALRAQTGASSVVSYADRDWGSDQATIGLVMWVRFTTVPGAITSFCSILDSTPAAILDLRVSAAGQWSVYNYGNTTTYTGTGGPVIAAYWHRVELKLYAHGSAGTIDVKIDGLLHPGISGLTGLNTLPGGAPRHYRLGVTVAQASAGARYFDSIIVGTDWIGRGRVLALRPLGNAIANWSITGTLASWQAMAVAPWTASTPGNSIYSSTANQEERYDLAGALRATTGVSVLGVQAVARCTRNTAGSAAGINFGIQSGATAGTLTNLDAGGTTPKTARGTLEVVDPATTAAWTVAGVNALQLRCLHDSGTNRVNVGGLLVYVALTSTLSDSELTTLFAGPRSTRLRRGQVPRAASIDDYYQRRGRGNHA